MRFILLSFSSEIYIKGESDTMENVLHWKFEGSWFKSNWGIWPGLGRTIYSRVSGGFSADSIQHSDEHWVCEITSLVT